MTEKRFKHKRNQLGMQFICYDDKAELLGTFADADGINNIVTLLNDLSDENEKLKSELAEIKRQEQEAEQEVFEYLRICHNGDINELKKELKE